MTIVDPRPPLRLTASEAKNWFTLHSEDIGRTVEIIGSPVLDSPPEYVEAWRGFARWERLLATDEAPLVTMFSGDLLRRPPSFFDVNEGGRVHINLANSSHCYSLLNPYTEQQQRQVAFLAERAPADHYIAYWTGSVIFDDPEVDE